MTKLQHGKIKPTETGRQLTVNRCIVNESLTLIEIDSIDYSYRCSICNKIVEPKRLTCITCLKEKYGETNG